MSKKPVLLHADLLGDVNEIKIGITCYPSVGGSGLLEQNWESNWRNVGMKFTLLHRVYHSG